MAERAMNAIELFDLLASHPGLPIYVTFGGIPVSVIDAVYDAQTGRIVLQAGEEWIWSEPGEDQTDQRRPKPEPGEP